MISAIAAVDDNWGIGNNNKLIFNIKEHDELFNELTLNNVVIMGRNTFEHLPNRQPLKDRINIVVTSNDDLLKYDDNLYSTKSIEDALSKARTCGKDIFIIGGASIYEQMLKYCDKLYITKANITCNADKYFPDITGFRFIKESEVKHYNSISYTFRIYYK